MALLRDVRAIVIGAIALARERPAELVARSTAVLAAMLLMPLFALGVPIGGVALFHMYAAASGHRPTRGKRGRTLAMVATGAAMPVSAVVAAFAESTLAPVSVPGLGALLVSAFFGMVLAPLHLASVTLLVEDRSLEEALGRVIIATTGRGRTVALAGALEGAVTVGLGVTGLSLLTADPLVWLSIFALLVCLSSIVHTVASVAAYDVLVKEHTGDFAAPRLGRVGLVLAPAILALTGALLFAAVAPLPAWIDRPLEELDLRPSEGARVELGTPSGLTVTADGGTLHVAVADGGGCGAIAGFSSMASPLAVIPTTFRGRPAFEIGRRGQRRVAFVDADGVRLDDTISDRLALRTGTVFFVLLALAAALVLALVVLLRAASSTAALLGSKTIGEAKDDATVALVGQLRLAEGARITLSAKGSSRVEGSVRFEATGGEIAIVVEEGERALGQVGKRVKDGAPAFVVAKAKELRTRTHRSSATGRAVLLGLGTISDARSAFLARESRRLVWVGLPAALLIAGAAAMIFAH